MARLSSEERREGDQGRFAEDSPTEAIRPQASLDSQGFAVLTTRGGREALGLSRRERPEVTLSDVLMLPSASLAH
jgi:DNA-binding response OmpR family regulator